MASVARLVVPLKRAEIADEVAELTPVVDTVKLAVLVFSATVTLTGTVATAVLLLLSVTTTPPAGAGPLSVTVPTDGFPPLTVLGFRLTELRDAALTLMLSVRVRLL